VSDWQFCCKFSDLRAGEPISKAFGTTTVGLFRVGESCYAIDDICPHALAFLTYGFQEGEVIECPLHGARFNVTTGECLMDGPLVTQDARTFETKVEDGDVFVKLPVAP